jgi:hypothetical protein
LFRLKTYVTLGGMADDNEIMIATRVSKTLYAKLLKRQRELEKLTGIEPSVSAIMRASLEKELNATSPKRKHTPKPMAAIR